MAEYDDGAWKARIKNTKTGQGNYQQEQMSIKKFSSYL